MPNRIEDDFGEAARHLRVDTLVMLRWSAIIGQTFALIYVYHYLKFDFPIGLCFVAVATSTALNIALRAGTPRSFRLDDSEAAVLLAFDILELAALLYLTGGVVNSFAMLFLAPVMISAVSLPRKLTLLLGILMVAAATLLTVEYLPLPWRTGEPLQFPLLYRLGVWSALVLSAAFVGLYAARVSDEARQLAGALSATELVLERAQHLTQLDGLAAAAAHELGTPLATITLISSELQKMAPDTAPAMKEDLALLAQEARRCREILRKLNSLGTQEAHVLNVLAIETLIEEVVGTAPRSRGGSDRNEGRAGPRSSLRAQSGHFIRPRQSCRKRGRFRQIESVDRCALDANICQHLHSGRRTGFRAENIGSGRRPLCERQLLGTTGEGRARLRPWTRALHRQDFAGALGRVGGDRQRRSAAHRSARDGYLAARRLRKAHAGVSSGLRRLRLRRAVRWFARRGREMENFACFDREVPERAILPIRAMQLK